MTATGSVRYAIAVCLFLFGVLLTPSGFAQTEASGSTLPKEVVAALQQGDALMIMRHAIAPGTGDPAEFTLDDCSTQRNLSDGGRAQARDIGQRLHESGIRSARVRHSQWCRCRDTAELLGYDDIEAMPILNSFFQGRGDRQAQTDALRDFVHDALSSGGDNSLLLVTHQVNITALTGVYPGSGELVIVHRSDNGNLTVIGTIETQ